MIEPSNPQASAGIRRCGGHGAKSAAVRQTAIRSRML